MVLKKKSLILLFFYNQLALILFNKFKSLYYFFNFNYNINDFYYLLLHIFEIKNKYFVFSFFKNVNFEYFIKNYKLLYLIEYYKKNLFNLKFTPKFFSNNLKNNEIILYENFSLYINFFNFFNFTNYINYIRSYKYYEYLKKLNFYGYKNKYFNKKRNYFDINNYFIYFLDSYKINIHNIVLIKNKFSNLLKKNNFNLKIYFFLMYINNLYNNNMSKKLYNIIF